MLTCLVSVLFTFYEYTECAEMKKKDADAKGLIRLQGFATGPHLKPGESCP